jgi:ATP-dependent RNA helicase DDX18/HAS1
MGLKHLIGIQHKSIWPLLKGRDLLAATKTGSEKPLTFLIPVSKLIVKLKFILRNGTEVLILSATRKLAVQTFGVLKERRMHHVNTCELIRGCSNWCAEEQQLANAINIIMAIPARVLDHMRNTPWFMYKNLQCLVIDEAECILGVGFKRN